MTRDAYYTPQWLAQKLIASSNKKRVDVVADFAAGDGVLLRAAQRRWKDAKIIASDLCEKSVRRLRRKHSSWHCTKIDFLESHQLDRPSSLSDYLGQIDQIVLNPPFSCRGGSVFFARTSEGPIQSGRAMAFVVASTQFLSSCGELLAVLPSNVLSSQKDAAAVKYLRQCFDVQCDNAFTGSSNDFQGCRVRYLIMKVSRSRSEIVDRIKGQSRRQPLKNRDLKVRIIRGTSQMHNLPRSGRTLVHTTELRAHTVELNGHFGDPRRPSVIGPAVLLPRVGAPRVDKVCLFLRRKRIVLSDCVVGLQCKSSDDARLLLSALSGHRAIYESMFSGTCAPYLTIKRLATVLHQLGCTIEK